MSGRQRSVTIVHNNIDGRSSIGSIAAWQVREALARDWRVTAVCRDLDPDLRGAVEHRPLYVPPRLHLLQWSVARPTVRRALRGTDSDVLLVHQPQLAAIADVWNVHYLSRAARTVRGPVDGLRSRVSDIQAAGVAQLEDRYLRRVPESTRVLFCSDVIRDQFVQLYGRLPNSDVLYNPALLPPADLPDDAVRGARRRHLTRGHGGPVVGFLGGGDPRKGGDLLVAAVANEPSLFLLHAGSAGLDDSSIADRAHSLGPLADVTELLDVVDALVVPSRFEPFGLVVAEAASRSVPSLVAPSVGVGPLAVKSGAGAYFDPVEPLGPLVADLIARRDDVVAGCAALVAELDPAGLADQLFGELDRIVERKQGGR